MQLSYSSSVQTAHPVQPKSLNQTDVAGNTVTGILVIILPTFFLLGAFVGRKCYRAYRAKVVRQQIETLERMWQISPNKHS